MKNETRTFAPVTKITARLGPRHRMQAGFSLIEVIFVLIIFITMTTFIYSLTSAGQSKTTPKTEDVKIWEEVRDNDNTQEFESLY